MRGTHGFAAAGVDVAERVHECVALVERGAVLRVVLVDVEREERRVDRGVGV